MEHRFPYEHLELISAHDLNPEVVELAYRSGYFPMAEPDGFIRWHCPDPRAVFPLHELKPSRAMRKLLERGEFRITVNQAFDAVIEACSRRDLTDEVWISEDIITNYQILHARGLAHSVETWMEDQLVGGLYGVHLGAAFFGESMFSHVSNASKVAFAGLIQLLQRQDFLVLDTQYINHFTEQLGAIEISKDSYMLILHEALRHNRTFAMRSDT